MNLTPIPDAFTGRRVVIGPSDPTRDDLRPCEYAVLESDEFPGCPRLFARVELDDNDRRMIANGAVLWLELDGGELPWQIHIVDDPEATPS